MSKKSFIKTNVQTKRVGRETNFMIVFQIFRDDGSKMEINSIIRTVMRGDFSNNAKKYAESIIKNKFNQFSQKEDYANAIKVVENDILIKIVYNKISNYHSDSFIKRIYAWLWLQIKISESMKLPKKNGILHSYFLVTHDNTLFDAACFSQSIDKDNENNFARKLITTISDMGTGIVDDYFRNYKKP